MLSRSYCFYVTLINFSLQKFYSFEEHIQVSKKIFANNKYNIKLLVALMVIEEAGVWCGFHNKLLDLFKLWMSRVLEKAHDYALRRRNVGAGTFQLSIRKKSGKLFEIFVGSPKL